MRVRPMFGFDEREETEVSPRHEALCHIGRDGHTFSVIWFLG